MIWDEDESGPSDWEGDEDEMDLLEGALLADGDTIDDELWD